MPLSKRFKDAIASYQILRAEQTSAFEMMISAQSAYTKAKNETRKKVDEILNELVSTIPAAPGNPDRVVEVDGKTFIISNSPRDVNTENPTYIREVQVEK